MGRGSTRSRPATTHRSLIFWLMARTIDIPTQVGRLWKWISRWLLWRSIKKDSKKYSLRMGKQFNALIQLTRSKILCWELYMIKLAARSNFTITKMKFTDTTTSESWKTKDKNISKALFLNNHNKFQQSSETTPASWTSMASATSTSEMWTQSTMNARTSQPIHHFLQIQPSVKTWYTWRRRPCKGHKMLKITLKFYRDRIESSGRRRSSGGRKEELKFSISIIKTDFGGWRV